MSFLETKINLLGVAVVATSFAFLPASAFANPPIDGQENMEVDVTPAKPVSGGFTGSDLNGDGLLDMSEFTLYAGNQAVAGDADFTAIVSSGDYETAFKRLDADGSGALNAAEVMSGAGDLDDNVMTEDKTQPESNK